MEEERKEYMIDEEGRKIKIIYISLEEYKKNGCNISSLLPSSDQIYKEGYEGYTVNIVK